jgi:hypothetical protein
MEPENPVAALFKKLEASEQEGPMQPQSKAEDLEAMWGHIEKLKNLKFHIPRRWQQQ